MVEEFLPGLDREMTRLAQQCAMEKRSYEWLDWVVLVATARLDVFAATNHRKIVVPVRTPIGITDMAKQSRRAVPK